MKVVPTLIINISCLCAREQKKDDISRSTNNWCRKKIMCKLKVQSPGFFSTYFQLPRFANKHITWTATSDHRTFVTILTLEALGPFKQCDLIWTPSPLLTSIILIWEVHMCYLCVGLLLLYLTYHLLIVMTINSGWRCLA